MPLNVIPFQFPGVPNVSCAFTGRAFGNVSLDLAAREDREIRPVSAQFAAHAAPTAAYGSGAEAAPSPVSASLDSASQAIPAAPSAAPFPAAPADGTAPHAPTAVFSSAVSETGTVPHAPPASDLTSAPAASAWERTVYLRRAIPAALGVNAFAEAHQVHGVVTLFEPAPQDPDQPAETDADGLATTRPGLALMIKTADCQPILIAHEAGRHILALHSGWKGNRQDYPFLAVGEFCERYGLRASELWAVRGPSLGPAAAEFSDFDAEWGPDFAPWYDSATRTMDLWSLARHQLGRAGLLPSRILGLDLCTHDNAADFFSYRRFRKHGLPDGRQASFIWIR